MADVISLDDKLELAKDKKAALIRRQKVLAVQKVLQCTQCLFKCEKCGRQISHNYRDGEKQNKNLSVPYRFCGSCKEEYIDYINQHKGKGDPDSYWHNKSWLDLWKKWIDYQGAIDSYLKSKEFLQLLQELKETRPDG
jgi:predicted amidophosphoribosyltransferase